MMFVDQSPIGYSYGYNGGMEYSVPPNPIANVGGYGYNQPVMNQYNPYVGMPTLDQQIQYQIQMQQQQMNYQQYQQPIGMYNNQPMGYYPQQGGYYSNNYYQGNPYLLQNQMEMQMKQQQQMIQQQSDIMKLISRNVNSYLGYEVDDEFLSQYDPIYRDPSDIKCEQQWDRMQRLEALSQQQQNVSTPISRMNQNNQVRMSQMKEKYPDDMSLFEFLEVAGELYAEAVQAKYKQQEMQVNRLYNQNDFRQLMNAHNSSNSYYNSIMNFNPDNISIDDFEVELPEFMKNSYSERKAKFFSAILDGGGILNG